MKDIQCKLVETREDLHQAYHIRSEVFVKEQKLFITSDRDKCDDRAIHIIAVVKGKVVGTVRVYEDEKGVWFGGRLAVLKPYRGRAGKMLIEKAIETVKKKKARRFVAYVQIPNVDFFTRQGWNPVGEVTTYQGRLHQLMESPL